MTNFYTDEKNTLVLISLLKKHGITKVVASPGTTNISFVASLQNDSSFEMYSSVDERSAAYLACGLAEESGEPVVLSCTGATASRNYLSGLTEAYYRKLPVLAITSTQNVAKVGHHIAQVIDRSNVQNDVVKLSVKLPIVKDEEDLWECEIKINNAILELSRHGGGPVHIDLPTTYSKSFDVKELLNSRLIKRLTIHDDLPKLSEGKVAIFIGSHKKMSSDLTKAIDQFCEYNNATVFCDHTSNYKGKYRILYALVACQRMFELNESKPDLLIHIGEVSGDYYSLKMSGKMVWRVSEDGKIRDTFRKLRYVFEMPEENFFRFYSKENNKKQKNTYWELCKENYDKALNKIPELPFSNVWVASVMAHKVPEESVVHFGILNSLRVWNFFELPKTVYSYSNVGGFGIDGNISSLVGASFFNKEKLYFGIVGDLALFYDMNVMGNHHLGNNVRILLINNGKGVEFRNYTHYASNFGNNADKFIAAGGHFGNKSFELIRDYATNLGFEYLTASNKDEFHKVYNRFLTPQITDKPMLFEVFTNSVDETDALEMMMNIEENVKGKAKNMAKKVLGQSGVGMLKKIIRK